MANSITIKISQHNWKHITELCTHLKLDPYLYAGTKNDKQAGLLIYKLSKSKLLGLDRCPAPNPEDYR